MVFRLSFATLQFLEDTANFAFGMLFEENIEIITGRFGALWRWTGT